MYCDRLKRLSLVVLAYLMIGNVAQAQQEPPRRGEFIGLLRAGLVTSQIYGDDIGGYNKLGGTLGSGVFTSIGNDLKLQLEINYAMRGSRKRPNPKAGDYTTYSIEPHYIDIPILIKKFIWKFEFEAGLNSGIFLFSRLNDPNFILPPTVKDFRRYELSANLGVNVPIDEKWHANARFHYSILPASGRLSFVNGINLLGGAYHNAITIGIVRVIEPRDG